MTTMMLERGTLTDDQAVRVGDRLTAWKGGTAHEVEVTRITRWQIVTDDWRTWWNHQEGRERGESVNHSQDHLEI